MRLLALAVSPPPFPFSFARAFDSRMSYSFMRPSSASTVGMPFPRAPDHYQDVAMSAGWGAGSLQRAVWTAPSPYIVQCSTYGPSYPHVYFLAAFYPSIGT